MFKEDKLIRSLKRKSKKAFHQIYERYADDMRFVCTRYIKDHDELSDVVQEGFLKLYHRIDQYKGDGHFEGWLRRIFINTSLDHLEKKKNRYEVYELNGGEENEKEYNLNLENTNENTSELIDLPGHDNEKLEFSQQELLEMVNELPEHFRVVFNLYVIDEYKHKEISEMLNINLKTSKTRLSRARKILKEKIVKKMQENAFK